MPLHNSERLHDGAADAALMTETAYAKVNLALHVRARRADGYHDLESLFVFARDGDVLTGRATADGAISLVLEGPFGSTLDAGEGNLVVRAARALRDYLGQSQGAALTLSKHLPVASGIGGGSADAAAALRLLTRLWGVRLADGEMERIALELGSDVPACLASVTQMVRGRGEVLEPRDVAGLAGKPMLLVNPGVALSTALVFQGWDRRDLGPLTAANLDMIIAHGRNDLERSAIAVAPVIADTLERLGCSTGVRVARMSGSGATCFALYDRMADRNAAAEKLRAERPDWWVLETEIRTR